jgi:hypothetical protein
MSDVDLTQLEEVLVPSLDHFNGVEVKKVLLKKSGGWAIEFVNNGIIGVEDDETVAPEIEGLSLLRTLYSAEETRIQFGKTRTVPGKGIEITDEVMLTLSPTQYFICDPRHHDGEAYWPNRAAVEDAEAMRETIRQQFEDRVVEGPENVVEQVSDDNATE